MLDDDFKKSAMEKVTTMSTNELKKAFKEIGSEPETNEEWFCQLPTEEKAKWLSKHFHCGDCIFEKPMCGGEYDGCKSAFVEWLKGEHK